MPVKRCSWGICNADNRYPDRYPGVRFIPFAKPKRQLEKCLRWIKACGRPHHQLNVGKIHQWMYICSKHFVDGWPSEQHPDPVPATNSDNDSISKGGRKPPLKRTEQPAPKRRKMASVVASGESQDTMQLHEPRQQTITTTETEITESEKLQENKRLEEATLLFSIQNHASSSQSADNVASANQNFVRGARVSRHLHTSSAVDKPYVCHLCAREFVQFRSLEVHTAHVHEVKVELSTVNTHWTGVDSCTEIGQGKTTDISRQDVLTDTAHTVKRETLDTHTDSAQTVKIETLDSHTDNAEIVDKEIDEHIYSESFSFDASSRASNQRDLLKEHSLVHFKSKSKLCKNDLNQPSSDIMTYEVTHSGHKPYVCKVCGKAFTANGTLRKHEQHQHSGYKPYICKVCGMAFNTYFVLREHERIHTENKPSYVCHVCEKAFTASCSLITHQLTHAVVKAYICNVREKAFTTPDVTHTGVKPYVCNVCGKAFNSACVLRTHEKLHNVDKLSICMVCGKAFSYPSHLRQHEQIHTKDKPYDCKVCGKAFAAPKDLKTHGRSHTGEKPYVCKVCGKAFAASSSLRVHERRVHSGKKPHVCKVCGKAFAEFSDLKPHERVHTGYKPYICKVCGKACSRFDNLRKHELIHTGEKPYICKFCGKAHNQSSNLKKHELIHTKGKP